MANRSSGAAGAMLAHWLMQALNNPSANNEFTTARQASIGANAAQSFDALTPDIQAMIANGDLVQDASGRWVPNGTISPARSNTAAGREINLRYNIAQKQGDDEFNQRMALIDQHSREQQLQQQRAHDLQVQGGIYGTPTSDQIMDINRLADQGRTTALAIDRAKEGAANYDAGTTALLNTPEGRMANAIAIQRKAVLGSTAIPGNAIAVPPSQLGGPGYVTPADRTKQVEVPKYFTDPKTGKQIQIGTEKLNQNVPGVTRPFVDPAALRADLQQFRSSATPTTALDFMSIDSAPKAITPQAIAPQLFEPTQSSVPSRSNMLMQPTAALPPLDFLSADSVPKAVAPNWTQNKAYSQPPLLPQMLGTPTKADQNPGYYRKVQNDPYKITSTDQESIVDMLKRYLNFSNIRY